MHIISTVRVYKSFKYYQTKTTFEYLGHIVNDLCIVVCPVLIGHSGTKIELQVSILVDN